MNFFISQIWMTTSQIWMTIPEETEKCRKYENIL